MTPATATHDLIIFDCDGVLVDSEMLSCQCLCESFGACGIDLGLKEIRHLFLGRSLTAVREFLLRHGRPPEPFLAALNARIQGTFRRSLQPIDGIAAVLASLHTPFCVASSSDLDRVSLALTVTGLAGHFGDRLYTSELVARGKPAPDLFLYAAARMKAEPARTLVVEDSVSGVTAARSAGMTVWGFVGGSHYRCGDGRRILGDAGADRIFERMADFWHQG